MLRSRTFNPSSTKTTSCKSCSPPSLRSKSFYGLWYHIVLTRLSYSHERIREMEHELFQSKLKPSVKGGLIPEIIRSSSSGLDSHRTAAMELLFERSIQERRERMFTEGKDSLRPDPISQSKGISEGSIIPTAPAWHAPQFLPPDASANVSAGATPVLVNHETPRDPPKPTGGTEVVRSEDPPVNAGVNLSLPKEVEQPFCRICGTGQSLGYLHSGVLCGTCFGNMKCAGCGTFKFGGTEACINCYRNFG